MLSRITSSISNRATAATAAQMRSIASQPSFQTTSSSELNTAAAQTLTQAEISAAPINAFVLRLFGKERIVSRTAMYLVGAALAVDVALVSEYWYINAKNDAELAGQEFKFDRKHYMQLAAIGTAW
jgi:hypothetical protein